ncbi:hypothetical protein [Cellulomonas soli]|uniref:Uncharacterized protein n=1 Tax=Cellulomonas soli TaxID=931535 RepID=A0A512PA88_9CELL|nr:hypothetical protein [Cellulomonas soli]NYI60612.1 hypothetical protein [Cellulomonas soli]GEP68127.1 hypothetical protein CSO01_08420 [Cellulomonas soli]
MQPAAAIPLVLVLLVASTLGGWPVTRGILHLASRSADAGEAPGKHQAPDKQAAPDQQAPDHLAPDQQPDGGDGPEGERARTALRGGTWIGLLERLAVTGSLMIGQPEVVAVVVAVKGLGRYPELRQNPGASERFVIGTLASLVWAAALGYLGRWLLA